MPAVAFILGALATAVMVERAREAENQEVHQAFELMAQRQARDLELRLSGLAQLGRSAAGLLGAGTPTTVANWQGLAAGLSRGGLGQSFTGLEIVMVAPDGLPSAAQAGLLRPPLTSLAAAGDPAHIDLISVPELAVTLAEARDRGEPTLSGPVRLMPGEQFERTHLLLITPFYRQGHPEQIEERRVRLAGMVVLTLTMNELLNPLLRDAASQGFGLRLRDKDPERLLFDSTAGSSTSAPPGLRHTVDVGGRSWTLEHSRLAGFADQIDRRSSILVGIVGALATLLVSGILTHAMVVQRRSTELAQEMTAELRRHRDHLAELVAERTRDLLAAKNIAEEASRTKSEFLANMSHELRTPLHAVLSFARMGQDRLSLDSDPKLQTYLHRIIASGNRLVALVNDLLDLSKIEAGMMHFAKTDCDLAAIVRAVTEDFSSLMEERGVLLEPLAAELVAPIHGDPLRLGQVMGNLLSNAVKFSPPGGRVQLEIEQTTMTWGRRASDLNTPLPAWRLIIADEGPGIPEGELEHVFDKFVQSSRTRTGAGGTGLGLAICREILLAHRGWIRASNRKTGGALLEIILPR